MEFIAPLWAGMVVLLAMAFMFWLDSRVLLKTGTSALKRVLCRHKNRARLFSVNGTVEYCRDCQKVLNMNITLYSKKEDLE